MDSTETNQCRKVKELPLQSAETPGVNQHGSVCDKTVIANGMREEWYYAKCDSMATRAETAFR